jgi:hypothetical protein
MQDLRRPRNPTRAELKHAGVNLLDDGRTLHCMNCGATWPIIVASIDIREDRIVRRRNGWWKCPGGCNAHATTD